MQRTLFGLALLIAVGAALPAGASVIAYSAAPADMYAQITNTPAFDSGASLSPFSVSASYPPPGDPPVEGAPSGNAQASVSSLLQSLAGFHIQGNLSATSVAGVSQSLGAEALARVQYYGFTISGPTMVYLRANVSRSVTGFDPGVGFFKANVCPAVGPCNPTGVDGLGTGVLGGISFTGTSFQSAVELAGGSYILDFIVYDKVFGNVPGGTGTASDGFSVDLQFEPFAVVPVPAAAWLFGSALGVMGWLRRKVV